VTNKAVLKMTDSTTIPGPITQRIEQLILEHGVPPDKVRSKITEITGLSKQALSKWFNGDTATPTVDHIKAITDHFHADPVWLLWGETSTQYDEQRKQAIGEHLDQGVPVNVGSIQTAHFYGYMPPDLKLA